MVSDETFVELANKLYQIILQHPSNLDDNVCHAQLKQQKILELLIPLSSSSFLRSPSSEIALKLIRTAIKKHPDIINIDSKSRISNNLLLIEGWLNGLCGLNCQLVLQVLDSFYVAVEKLFQNGLRDLMACLLKGIP
jgi:hypothetical protein